MDNGVIQTRIDILEKAIRLDPGNTALTHEMNELIKGRRAQIGEIRTWNGKKVQKQSDGKWKPIKSLESKKQKKGEEEPNVKPKENSLKEPSNKKYIMTEEEAIDLVLELASQDYQLFNDKKALDNINNIIKDSGMSADDFLDKVEDELDKQADHLINEGEYDEEEIYEEHESYLEVIKLALKLSNNSYK